MRSARGLTVLVFFLFGQAGFDGYPVLAASSGARAYTENAGRDLAMAHDAREPRRLTLDDDRGKITLAVGDQLLVALGGDWDWTLEDFDTAILNNVTSKTLPKDAQALLEAKRTGRTELSLTGDPPCQKSRPPCGLQSRRFRVTITVQ